MALPKIPAQKKKPLVPPPPIGRPPVAAPTPIAAKPDPYAGMPPDLAAQMRGMDKRGTVAKAQAAATKGTVRGNNVQGTAPAPAAPYVSPADQARFAKQQQIVAARKKLLGK